MFVKGEDVSALSTDEIIARLSADDFPSPFTGGVPAFGKINDRYVMMPQNYHERMDFLKTCEGVLADDKLNKLLDMKASAEQELREVDEDITGTLKRGEGLKGSPTHFAKILVAIEKALGAHYHASGDIEQANEHYSAAIGWYDHTINVLNHYAQLYDKDDRALVIEEGQRGIFKDTPVGTVNIQTCIACVVKSADGSMQLVHFNHGSNIPRLLDQIRQEMPGPYTITPIGAALPEKETPYNHQGVRHSKDNVRALVDALKGQPDVHVDAAWLLKKVAQQVTAIVVDPKDQAIRIAFPGHTHPNEVLERGLVNLKMSGSTHDIKLCFDLRQSPQRKPVLLDTESIDVHNTNVDAHGGKDFLKCRADKIDPGMTVLGPNYLRYVVMGKMQKAHEAAIASVATEFERSLGPIIDHCRNISLDGSPVSGDDAVAVLQKQVERLPKFIGEGQEALNKQLVQSIMSNRELFQTDGDASLDINTAKLGDYAAAEAKNLIDRAMASRQAEQTA